MTDDKTRAEFETKTPVPNDVKFNEQRNEYVWRNFQTTPAPFNEQWESFCDGWQAAKERYGYIPVIARSLSEWHEDDGPALWWAWCGNDWAGEPAWAGTPLDDDWPGYHTHWTPHQKQPTTKEQKHEQ